jgi:hypothetical protein
MCVTVTQRHSPYHFRRTSSVRRVGDLFALERCQHDYCSGGQGMSYGAAIAGAGGAAVAATRSTAAVTLHVDGCWEVFGRLERLIG